MKWITDDDKKGSRGRSPLRGAWIEIASVSSSPKSGVVAPRLGERGLKSMRYIHYVFTHSRSPLRGAWIEIVRTPSEAEIEISRSPLRGAWIEISKMLIQNWS